MPVYEDGVLIRPSPLGHEKLAVSTASVALVISGIVNDRIRRTMIKVIGQPVTYRDDGVAPTSITGFYLAAGDIILYDSDPALLRFIRASDATADSDLRIAYYGV